MSEPRTYLDHNATAPLRAQSRAAMLAALDLTGNASSVHSEGRRARATVETAREQVAALVGVAPEQVVFTSGATEANTWALRAGWTSIVMADIEHESVLAPARASGARLVGLDCDADGRVSPDRFASLLDSPELATAVIGPGKALLTLQAANSETGVLQPVADCALLAHARGLVVHCDAVQAAGRIALDMASVGVDLMSLSAHKLGGPKGVGALIIRPNFDLPGMLVGGNQERRRRAGTENIAGIAGFGAAAVAARADRVEEGARLGALRDRLEAGVRTLTPTAVVIGAGAPRLANTSCIALPGAHAAMLLIKLDLAGIAVSAGSACSSGKIGGSHVLAAMGVAKPLAQAAIRVSLGATTTGADIERFLATWASIARAVSHHQTDDNGRRTSHRAPHASMTADQPPAVIAIQAGE